MTLQALEYQISRRRENDRESTKDAHCYGRRSACYYRETC